MHSLIKLLKGWVAQKESIWLSDFLGIKVPIRIMFFKICTGNRIASNAINENLTSGKI